MNKALSQFISIIITGLALITAYSFMSYELKIGDIVVKKTSIKDYLLYPDSAESEEIISLASLQDSIKKDTVVVDTTSQNILLIGDSMLEGLMLRMKDYTKYNGHKLKTVIWYSAQSKWYGKYDTLKYFIKKYKPTYIFLVLGANELFVRDIKNKRRKYVRKIIADIDTIPYVWVGPPNWKDDTGINDLIIANAGKKHYFPSKDLKYRRTKDGAHPTHRSAAMWMDSIASWVRSKSFYRIKMKQPDKKYKGTANATLLQPLK